MAKKEQPVSVKQKQPISVLGILIILVVVLFIFGIYGQNLTIGSTVKTNKVTTISVSPKVVAQGQTFKISVDPGTKGVYSEEGLEIYMGDTRKETIRDFCEGYHICYDDTPAKDPQAELTVTQLVSVGWKPGQYTVVAEDCSNSKGATCDTKQKIKAYFQVVEAR